MRILILRGGAIGDFVVTTPVLRSLRETWPDCYIVLVGYPHIARLALQSGLADEVRSLDEVGMARFFSWKPEFDEEQIGFISSFDLVISFLHDPGGIVRKNLTQAGARFVIYRSPLVRNRHAVDQMMLALQDLPVPMSEGAIPQLTLPESRLRRGRDILQEFALPAAPVAIHPGSGSPRKNWSLDNFISLRAALREELHLDSFFVLGEADQHIRDSLERRKDAPPVVDGLPLTDTAALLAASRAFIGNDSGVTHVAAALGLPTVAIFGPSDPSLWGPRGKHVRILQAADRQLSSVSVSEVLDALRQLLSHNA
ncbi:MAG: hypothetical protein DRP22_03015 [Verrucomicrobia bacterium]|nr:MAG: hypothetical protein DRP22_03015 [Verrucomicrobiota bacterium]